MVPIVKLKKVACIWLDRVAVELEESVEKKQGESTTPALAYRGKRCFSARAIEDSRGGQDRL